MATAVHAACFPSRPATSGSRVRATTRKRILVVDDDASVLYALRRLFDVLDVDVATCSDPERAVALLGREAFDLVISDERMPKMSGLEMLRRVRATCPRTPTILMSAYADPAAFVRAYETCGVFRTMAKPWDNADLIVTVREALRAADALAG